MVSLLVHNECKPLITSGDIISFPSIYITTVAVFLLTVGTGQCEGVRLPHDYNE